MGVVKNRPSLDAPDRLSARYAGVPVIYVESEDDYYVFGECWFKDRLSHVEFIPAARQCGFSGCSAVVAAVADARSAGNSAWGIVDRDTVMSENLWHLVDETNDAIYECAKPFGTEIKALCRWEMENYLADGNAMEKCRAEIKSQLPRLSVTVYDELLNHCQALIPHAAMNAVCHLHRVEGLKDGYVKQKHLSTREDVDAEIRAGKLTRLPSSAAADYAQQTAHVDAFDLPGETPRARVNALLRRVHGKALLARFAAMHSISIDLKGLLANRIREMALVPAELASFVDEVATGG